MTQTQLSRFNPSMQKSYRFIVAFVKEKGYGPTIREIMDDCNLSSTSVATYHRDEFIKAGLITHDPTRERSIDLVGSFTFRFYEEDAEYMRMRFSEIPGADFVRFLRNEAMASNWSHARS